MFKIHFTCLF